MSMIFDPALMKRDISNPEAVREWREYLKRWLVMSRGYYCECCGEPSRQLDMHEAIVTRQDVRGWPYERRGLIYTEVNVMLIDHAHHLQGAPSREEAWDHLSRMYGADVLREWYSGLPFKVLPRRFW